MEEKKFCKKCGKPLAADCRNDLCERCMNQNAEKIKKGGAAVLGALAAVGGIAVAVIKGVLRR